MRYNKEGLREELRQALLVVPRTRGQLEGFEDNCCDSKHRAPTREIEIGEGSIKVKAEVVRTSPCKVFKTSPMPLPPQAFKFTRLVKAINTARTCLSDWLRYCYSDGPQLPSRELLLALLTQFALQEEKALRESSVKLIKHLALLACQQKRHQINIGKDLLSQTKIAELAGKSESSWNKRWSGRWKRLLLILEKFDNEGLDHVCERGRREKAAKRHSNMLMQHCIQPAARTKVVA